MASFPTNGWNLPGNTGFNTPGPFNLSVDNDATALSPTFADIQAHAASFTSRARRRPFAVRRYMSERKPPLGYRRPLSPYVARRRMLAKILEFEDRFNSAQTYDVYCEPVSYPTAPYDHADVLNIVAPWMYPYHEEEHLVGMMARARI